MTRKRKWTLERCKADAMKYSSRSEWYKESAQGYFAARRNDWLETCCAHMARPKTGYTLDDCIKEAKKYNTKLEWQTASKSTYHKALSMDWIDKCCQHMPARSNKQNRSNAKNNKWSIEKLKEDASQYATRSEWRKESPLAYGSAYRKGVLDECCQHM